MKKYGLQERMIEEEAVDVSIFVSGLHGWWKTRLAISACIWGLVDSLAKQT